MPSFNYTARSKAGTRIQGTLEAADRHAALSALAKLGHTPISIQPAAESKASHKRESFFKLSRPASMNAREVSLFTSELCDLLDAGMTLGNALNCLATLAEGEPRGPIITALRDAIVGGATFSEALAAYPAIFTPIYVNMIRAGEASGSIPSVLRRLIQHFERLQSIRTRVTSAMVYPIIVLVMGFGVGIFSVTFILPKFKTIFDQMGPDALPAMTKVLLSISDWLTHYGIFLLFALVVGFFVLKRWTQTPTGRLHKDRFLLKAPLLKGMIASSVYATFASTLQSLLENGVPVLRALAITAQTANNSVISEELLKARDRVTDGTTISGPLAASAVFPPMLIHLISIGEQTGDLASALGHVSKRYETELDRNVSIFTTALEPILIFVVALVIGFIAISIMMAVLSVTSGVNVH